MDKISCYSVILLQHLFKLSTCFLNVSTIEDHNISFSLLKISGNHPIFLYIFYIHLKQWFPNFSRLAPPWLTGGFLAPPLPRYTHTGEHKLFLYIYLVCFKLKTKANTHFLYLVCFILKTKPNTHFLYLVCFEMKTTQMNTHPFFICGILQTSSSHQ